MFEKMDDTDNDLSYLEKYKKERDKAFKVKTNFVINLEIYFF